MLLYIRGLGDSLLSSRAILYADITNSAQNQTLLGNDDPLVDWVLFSHSAMGQQDSILGGLTEIK